MKDRVVCLKGGEWITMPGAKYPNPVKGEIYTAIPCDWNDKYIFLLEFGTEEAFLATNFRPVDTSYGEYVESTIMKEAELEAVIN
jgi:hypothetical protein